MAFWKLVQKNLKFGEKSPTFASFIYKKQIFKVSKFTGIASSPLMNQIEPPPYQSSPDMTPQQFVVPIFPIGTYPTTPHAGQQFMLFSPLPAAPSATFDQMTPTIPGKDTHN